ncbi:MAG: T9SS type A sorting domain-containing protein [Bacteroidetes bacterium]|jgi:hypothetical protein|nr:T9SS type A sorting domain-containing protein [Bacteroidota bacterium]MBT5990424.1 T9SS type A sorting domain-containing protein [Bacteroidota bacterium]
MKRIFIILIFVSLLSSMNSQAQLKNNGAVLTLTSGSSLVISGFDYVNQSSGSSHGDINLSGTIYLDGDWTNNATAGQLLDSTASTGTVVFNGSTTQTISGMESHFYNLSVNSGAAVNVSAGDLVKVYNDFTNNGDFTLKASSSAIASLIDAGSSSNLLGSGNYKIERYMPSAGWHYVSSPLTKASSTTNVFWGAAVYSYVENTNSWQAHYNNEQLDVMKGYDIYYKTASPTISFSGTYNTGNQSIALTKSNDGYNFVGNPYPCTIDWDASSGWTKTNVYNGIYIWDATLLSGLGDYMEYVGGVGNNGGTRYIPPTQAFFVFVPNGYSSGTIGVSNAVKVNKTSVPFRTANKGNYIRFKVTEGTLTNSTVLRLHEAASELFDGDFDTYKIFHSNKIVPQLYTELDAVNYSINTIGYVQNNTIIPLNYKPGQSGHHKLEFDLDAFEDALISYDIILEDTKTGAIVDFKQQKEYSFQAEVGDNEKRFLIHLAQAGSIKSVDFNNPTSITETEKSVVSIYASHHEIVFKSNNRIDGQLSIYDVSGKQLFTEWIENSAYQTFAIPSQGVYLVSFENNEISSNTKVLIQ